MSFLKTLFFLLIWGLSLAVPVTAEEPRSEEAPPEISQDLIDPQIPTEELAHLLIPLKKEELEQLARLWQNVGQSETQSIADEQISLLRNPEKATDIAYQK
ncbi:MAG: mechanosensitive ion channel family protein, partial [Deltaproteobacteria bacterium]|nr:mechanosensitive ion channel family protein [Deltaproteobacteria bacterium]